MLSRSLRLALSSTRLMGRNVFATPALVTCYSRTFHSAKGKAESEATETLEKESVPEAESKEAEEVSTPVDDAYAAAMKEYEAVELEAKKLHGDLLLRYANAENKRRERNTEIKRRDGLNISSFGNKATSIFASLDKTCELADKKANALEADVKVKSLAEGLRMTRGIMKNILVKHNISKDSS